LYQQTVARVWKKGQTENNVVVVIIHSLQRILLIGLGESNESMTGILIEGQVDK